ncbi:long-chain-fatty-acid--CoA ligase [Methyloversatilis thermotolerans]|uniref:long-chain-fatty-acid--CoA ligase n=1 Tax=Methyloversatilis thermotolerans TaxID=1346290 RepID=UPI00036372B6|nr:long-chain-fatty-acid--CoA ligase [Methyloversatilis thermotolerans]
MEKVWLRSYPEGVPAEIDPSEFMSIGEVFERSCREFATRDAFVCMGKALSFAELDRLSAAFGAHLQSGLGLAPGTRIALMMPNVLQYPIAMFGALRAGYTIVNCNPLYTPRELEHQLNDSGAEVIVVLENFASTLQRVIARTSVRHVIVTAIGDLLDVPKGWLVNFVVRHVKKMVPSFDLPDARRFNDVLKLGRGAGLNPVSVVPEDIAFLQYTGGTTGVAKGAMLTHRNIVSNMMQAHVWIRPFLKGEQVVITALPLYHIFALTANCLVFFQLGATNVLITNPRDISGFVKELAKYRFTVMTGVNTLFNALLNNPDFANLDFSALKVSLGGGMAVQRAVADRWMRVTGQPLIEAYGLTETSPAVCINRPDETSFTGSIGLPIPSTEISIRDDSGNELGIGDTGELCVRGPQVMKGYFRRPVETAEITTDDGFLRTGDIASVDERGYVKLVDRKKDMILVSGFNVYPNEVEEVIASCPGVLECCAIGLPDERSGEVVKVFVVARDASITEQQVIEHCRGQLTSYKIPKSVEFRKELPKTNVGKILRRALKEEVRKS